MKRLLFVLATLIAGGASSGMAQPAPRVAFDSTAVPDVLDGPIVVPGSVVSFTVQVPARAGARTASFRIDPGTKVMVYGASTGGVEWADNLPAALPLTFSVPRTEAAGIMHIARVTVTWEDGGRWITEIQSRVQVKRGLELQIARSMVAAGRGGSVRVPISITNRGNAPDTLALRVHLPPRWDGEFTAEQIALPAGQTHEAELRVDVPPDAFLGESQVLRIVAAGLGSEASGTAQVEVVGGDEGSGWVTLPSTLLLGLSDATGVDAARLNLGLEASGIVFPNTEASLMLRHTGYAYNAPAFQRYMVGPSFRLEIKRPESRVAVGDVLLGSGGLAGGFSQGSGLDGEFLIGNVRSEVLLAQPNALDAPRRDGHLARVRSSLPVGDGEASLTVADLNRPFGVSGETDQTQLFMLGYRWGKGTGHRVTADAGFMRLSGRAESSSGPALDASYNFHNPRLDVSAHVRRVPAALPTSGTAVNEAFVSAAAPVMRDVTLTGWAVTSSSPMLNGSETERRAASMSLRWRRDAWTANLTGNIGDNTGTGLLTGSGSRRSISLGVGAPIGPLRADAMLEAGRSRVGSLESPLRSLATRLSYSQGPAFLWLASTYTDGVFGPALHRIDAAATYRARRFDLEGGIGSYLGSDANAATTAWLSSSVHVDQRTSVVLGVDYQPGSLSGAGARFSIGARRSLSLPLPFRRTPVAAGLLFDDRNGNLERDAGEPPLANIALRRGWARVETDDEGRYAFYDDKLDAQEVTVDVSSLDGGLLLPPGTRIPARGSAIVPLLRAASLKITLFNDTDSDGTRDDGEGPAAGASIELVDARQRTRTASANAHGEIEFRALPPGAYTVRVYPAQRPAVPQKPRTWDLVLLPGESHTLDAGVPHREREIRFRSGTQGE